MQLKYATTAITITMIMAAAGTCAAVVADEPLASSASSSSSSSSSSSLPSPSLLPEPPVATAAAADSLAWTEVMECYKKPRAAIGCLESRMGRALAALRNSAVNTARSDPDTAAEDAAGVGEFVQQIGEFIKYSVSSYFRGAAAADDDDDAVAAAGAGGSGAQVVQVIGSDASDEGRGHHKKKKIQKEIKKFVLKVLFGIYLFKQKIKMILMSIQSILMSKFLIVAMIYALSNTFKIWYDIKWSKHHGHHDKVVYYENAHHQHHYEPPEHGDYEDPHHGGSIWGRSIAVTEPSGSEHSGGSMSHHDGISRYIRRVSRTANEAQAMAFQAQMPGQQ